MSVKEESLYAMEDDTESVTAATTAEDDRGKQQQQQKVMVSHEVSATPSAVVREYFD